jgi:hypothetical protein
MTIAVTWVRTVGDCEELLFVSDSRVSGDGRIIDVCAKVITLPRSDCAISFAGYTGNAYPLLHQLAYAISAHGPLMRRGMDIRQLRGHALQIFNGMADGIQADLLVRGAELASPDATFIFGGYSWVSKSFEFWQLAYDESLLRFKANTPLYALTNSRARKLFWTVSGRHGGPNQCLGRIAFAGDQGAEAQLRLTNLLTTRFQEAEDSLIDSWKFDMEPFEVVRDMLRDSSKATTIGGAPQILKVYQYMHTAPIGVYWPNRMSNRISFLGRSLLDYENIDYWVMDPDTLITYGPNETNFRDRNRANGRK